MKMHNAEYKQDVAILCEVEPHYQGHPWGCAKVTLIGRASGSRYMARLRATGTNLGTGHMNNIRWMTVVSSD